MRIISDAIRQSAKGESCTMRLYGCLSGNETVVFCHAPGTGMKGIGMKVPDIFGFYACMSCHQKVDQHRDGWDYKDIVRAIAETQIRLISKNILIVKGMKK